MSFFFFGIIEGKWCPCPCQWTFKSIAFNFNSVPYPFKGNGDGKYEERVLRINYSCIKKRSHGIFFQFHSKVENGGRLSMTTGLKFFGKNYLERKKTKPNEKRQKKYKKSCRLLYDLTFKPPPPTDLLWRYSKLLSSRPFIWISSQHFSLFLQLVVFYQFNRIYCWLY